MEQLSKREINMLVTFLTTSRFWRTVPDTVFLLCDKGMVKPTKFGRGNFQITEQGRDYLRSTVNETTTL